MAPSRQIAPVVVKGSGWGVPQLVLPQPLNNFPDFARLMGAIQMLPVGQTAFTIAVPYTFELLAEFTPEALAEMKDTLREQFELALEIVDRCLRAQIEKPPIRGV